MTRKDYIKIGEQFRNAMELVRLLDNNKQTREVVEAIIRDFSTMLKKDNAKFNEEKFIKFILN